MRSVFGWLLAQGQQERIVQEPTWMWSPTQWMHRLICQFLPLLVGLQ